MQDVFHNTKNNWRGRDHIGCPFCQPEKIERAPILWDYCTSDVLDGEIDCFHLLAEWDYEKNYPLTPKDVKTVEYRKVWWICPHGHSYEKIISNRTQQGQGCPVCRALVGEKGSMLIHGVNDLATTHPEIAAEWNYERNGDLKPSAVKPGSCNIVWWRCKYGHEWEAPVARSIGKRKIGCPGCSGSSTYKKYEDMGCVKEFAHFGQGQGHVWRKQPFQNEKITPNVDIAPNVTNPADENKTTNDKNNE